VVESIVNSLAGLSVWELLAVILAVAYLVLAVRQNIWCWGAAAVSTLIYLFVFYRASLYMESMLQLFYLGMAAYGYHQWRGRGQHDEVLAISVWPLRHHLAALAAIVLLSALTGAWMDKYTAAALPYADAFTTVSAMLTTYMVARKILENWVYWFVIDSVSIYLYVSRELYLTALLFCVYLVLIVVGFIKWKKDYDAQDPAAAAEPA
jgi:nicotinamide mononucleotide transporter